MTLTEQTGSLTIMKKTLHYVGDRLTNYWFKLKLVRGPILETQGTDQ